MVCDRCKLVIDQVLSNLGLHAINITLGEVEFSQKIQDSELGKIQAAISPLGFELISDKKSRLIENIKKAIIELIHGQEEINQIKLSVYLNNKIHYDYNHLSQLFSSVEGITLEQYFIHQKIERVKELLVYDELSLTEIAHQLGYSSLAHLSGQFKKVTGMTPSHFKGLRDSSRRRPLDDL